MYKKTVKYQDLDGNDVEDTLYFNYTAAQLSTLLDNLGIDVDNVQDYVQRLQNNEDVNNMVKFVHQLIVNAYGERSSDAKHFVKNDEVRENFENSLAFDAIFLEFMKNPSEFEEFVESATRGLQQLAKSEDSAKYATALKVVTPEVATQPSSQSANDVLASLTDKQKEELVASLKNSESK